MSGQKGQRSELFCHKEEILNKVSSHLLLYCQLHHIHVPPFTYPPCFQWADLNDCIKVTYTYIKVHVQRKGLEDTHQKSGYARESRGCQGKLSLYSHCLNDYFIYIHSNWTYLSKLNMFSYYFKMNEIDAGNDTALWVWSSECWEREMTALTGTEAFS